MNYNPQDRNPFIALVLAVTCVMLATTAIVIGIIVLNISELNKTKNSHNESAHTLLITQENSDRAIDMEPVKNETVTPGSLSIAKSRDTMCIDIKDHSIEHRTETNQEVDAGILAKVADLKVDTIVPMVPSSMIDFGKQRLASLTRSLEQPPLQEVISHHDRTQSLTLLQNQVTPPGPKYFQAQGQFDQGQGQGYPPGQGYPQPPPYPQSHGYPPSPQSHGYPPNPQHQVYQGQEAAQGYPNEGYGYPGDARMDYNPQDRNPFIALVLAVTCIMLATTAIIIGIIVLNPNLTRWVRKHNMLIMIPSMIVLLGLSYAFVCCDIARKPPCGTFLLILTTAAMTGLAGVISAYYNTEIIMQAFLATAIIVGICTMLACTKFDFTSYMIYFVLIGLVLFVVSMIFFGVQMITGKRMKWIHLVILLVCVLLQSLILIAELQMILGGRSIELREDEWALGAYYLYTSIMDMFLKMLSILGIFDNN